VGPRSLPDWNSDTGTEAGATGAVGLPAITITVTPASLPEWNSDTGTEAGATGAVGLPAITITVAPASLPEWNSDTGTEAGATEADRSFPPNGPSKIAHLTTVAAERPLGAFLWSMIAEKADLTWVSEYSALRAGGSPRL
jgi:hypothetical protein